MENTVKKVELEEIEGRGGAGFTYMETTETIYYIFERSSRDFKTMN